MPLPMLHMLLLLCFLRFRAFIVVSLQHTAFYVVAHAIIVATFANWSIYASALWSSASLCCRHKHTR